MAESNVVERVAEQSARGVVREQTTRLRERVEPPIDDFKDDTAERVENLAEHVRTMGRQLNRRDEAHAVARRLERTADYLRFRPTADVASDAWKAFSRSRAVWVVGGTLVALVAYRAIQSSVRDRD